MTNRDCTMGGCEVSVGSMGSEDVAAPVGVQGSVASEEPLHAQVPALLSSSSAD
jgi:hypothetical protein